jgi:hypothetical protein
MIKLLSILIFFEYAVQSLPAFTQAVTSRLETTDRMFVRPEPSDTSLFEVSLSPTAGDSWQEIQDAVNYYLNTGVKIRLLQGNYYISRPIVIANIQKGIYRQSSIQICGTQSAKNAPAGVTATIIPTFNNAPAIAIQQGKNITISNLAILGQFTFPNTLNPIQVDTLLFSDWDDDKCRQNASSPYAGIAIDFASDPLWYDGKRYQIYPTLKSYYLSGMSRAGSTAITVEGVSIKNFVVGMIITPSNQQNGEIIHLYHSQVEACKTGYAICQAQSKHCEIKDLECWLPVFTLFDNCSYGIRHGDGAGSPVVDGVNIAGSIHQIFQINNYVFHGSFRNIYGEGVFKIGMIGGNAGAELNCEVDFANSVAGVPSPDYYFYANNTVFQNCILRLYAGAVFGMRITHNGSNNTFIGGQQTAPPLINVYGGSPTSYPRIIGMAQYNLKEIIDESHYDTSYFNTVATLHVNPHFSGWFTKGGPSVARGDISKVKPGDIVVTAKLARDIFSTMINTYPVGYCQRVSGDTIFLTNIGVGLHDGDVITAVPCGIKHAHM